MVNSNDRREVARMLCEQADEGYGVNLESMAYALGLDSDDGGCGDEDVFEMLADLIDHKCEVTDIRTGEDAAYECPEHIMHCENCGAEFGYVLFSEDGDVSMDDKPSYCPNCGARVVSD